jgi:hypothetical protein
MEINSASGPQNAEIKYNKVILEYVLAYWDWLKLICKWRTIKYNTFQNNCIHICQCTTLNINIFNYLLLKIMKIVYFESTHRDK